MTTERLDDNPLAATGEGSPFAPADEDFLDVLCRFLRTIPIYPDGHSRVVSVAERLHAVAAGLSEPVVVAVADRGLLVNGADRDPLGAGPRALREALLATAVVRATFHPDAPPASYVAFARALQRNARLASNGRLAFTDLWMAPIAGIEVAELVFSAEGYAVDGDGAPTDEAEGGPTVLGSIEGGIEGGAESAPVPGSLGIGDGAGGDGASEDGALLEVSPPLPPPRIALRPLTVSRDVRQLVAEDPELEAAIFTLEVRLLSDRRVGLTREAAGGADVLEHLVRTLPLEARLDPAKGVAVLRRVVTRLLARMPQTAADAGPVDLATRFFQVLERVFPKRESPAEAPPHPATTDVPELSERAASFDELHVLDDSILEGLGVGASEGPAPAPELTAEVGIDDQASVLLHAVLEEPAGPRRDELRTLAVAAHVVRPRGAPTPCLVRHLAEAIGAPPDRRDAGLVALLESIAVESGVALEGGLPSLDFASASALFPVCFGPYLRGGGRAGAVARRVGRERVLAAVAALVAPRGALSGDLVEKVLGERSFDALPFLEALLVAAPSLRPRVARALRVLDFKSLAAIAFRVVPEERLTAGYLQVLCEDGFAGLDSRRLDAEAAEALGSIVVDDDHAFDVRTRAYATASLGAFPPSIAEPALRIVAQRRLFGGAPKEVRLAAAEILQRFARAAAEARPIP